MTGSSLPRFEPDELERRQYKLGDTEVLEETFRALTHLYRIPKQGKDAKIPLYRGKFDVDGHTYQGVGYLTLGRSVDVIFEGQRPFTDAEKQAGHTQRLEPRHWVTPDRVALPVTKVPEPPKTARVDSSTRFFQKKGYRGSPEPVTVGTDVPVDRVTFFVLNGWPPATDTFMVHCGGYQRLGGMRFNAGDWEFTFTMRPDASPSDVHSEMRRDGHNTVTHVGMLRRHDRQPFIPTDCLQVLEVLDYALAFTLGRTTACVLPVGWQGDTATWTRWYVDRWVDDPRVHKHSWLDDAHTQDQLQEVLDRLLAARPDPLKWQGFEHALDYYLTANAANPRMQALMAVGGLTFMSEAVLVTSLPAGHSAKVSKTKWGNLTAEDQIRPLVNYVRANTAVPAHFAELNQARQRANTKAAKAHAADPSKPLAPPADALFLLVKMRNDAAHPQQKKIANYDLKEWAEAADCGLEILLVCMLNWIGYRGRYMPATAEYNAHGRSTPVP